jgi:hypothetical protein
MPQKREEGASAVVAGKLYVFGGFYDSTFKASKRVDIYDPKTNAWKRLKDMPEDVTHAPAVVVGATVWLFGGYIGQTPGPAITHVWKYDTLTNTWSRGPEMPHARGAGAAVLVGRTIHYLGGRWWLAGLLFLVPDLSFAAYLAGSRTGAYAYNALHTTLGPLALAQPATHNSAASAPLAR